MTSQLIPTKPTNASFQSFRPIVTSHLVDPGTPFIPGTRVGSAPWNDTYTTFAGESLHPMSPFRKLDDALAAAAQITQGSEHPGVAVMKSTSGSSTLYDLHPLMQTDVDNIQGTTSFENDVEFEPATWKVQPGKIASIHPDLLALVDGGKLLKPSVGANGKLELVED